MERSHQKLVAWRESYDLCIVIYRLTKKFPPDERFGLVSQMRRASSSVPINIAEGNARRSMKERTHFFDIALASLEEVHCEAMLSKDFGYMTETEFQDIDQRVNRISYLTTKLRSSIQ